MNYEVKQLTPFRLLSIYAYDAIKKGHNMFALIELDVTDIRQRLRARRKEGHKTSFFGFLLSAVSKAKTNWKESGIAGEDDEWALRWIFGGWSASSKICNQVKAKN